MSDNDKIAEKKLAPLVVPVSEDGQRLDRFLNLRLPEFSFSDIRRLCRKGQIRLNGSRVKGMERLKAEDELRLPPFMMSNLKETGEGSVPLSAGFTAEGFQAIILHEDADCLVVNKPAGIPSQGGSKQRDSMDAWAKAYHPDLKLVHRLDKDTSGCLMFGKGRSATAFLTDAFKSREVKKVYWAIGCGIINHDEDICDRRIKKEGAMGEQKMVVSRDGLEAETRYWKIAAKENISWLALQPLTGRMHQIRVHMLAMRYPIVNDVKYGGPETRQYDPTGYGKLFLHARQVTVPHPTNAMPLMVDAPIPPHFEALFRIMGWQEE